MIIERCTSAEHLGWLELRQALWADCPHEQHLLEMAEHVAVSHRFADFVALSEWGKPVGLAEASVRTDPVNGIATSPVPFLEGLYVVPEERRKGVATALIAAVMDWAKAMGHGEIGSDAVLDNDLSHVVH